MPTRKQYADPAYYERKLDKVMERFGVTEYNHDWTRHAAHVEFRYKGQLFRFDHTVENARAHGENLTYGSDAFAQIVLCLEDLARVVGRGLYDLQTWVAGMAYLPPPIEIPAAFQVLGFQSMPANAQEVQKRYRTLAQQYHPDKGGDAGEFEKIKVAAEQAMKHMEAAS